MHLCKQVLNKEEVQQVLQAIDQENWSQGSTKRDKSHKDNQELRESSQAQFVASKILECDIIKTYGFFKHLTPVRFNKYENAGKYNEHVDFFQQNGIRTDWSMTLFLTDDYAGGELVIEGQPVKPNAGDMVLYPSGKIHGVNPVTDGRRIAAIAWAQSYVEDEHERNILGRVAESIQSLERKDAPPRELVNLSFVYTNLLKKWSK